MARTGRSARATGEPKRRASRGESPKIDFAGLCHMGGDVMRLSIASSSIGGGRPADPRA